MNGLDAGVISKPRLEVKDREEVFYTLLARIDRLLTRNPFPVADHEDFALSLLPPDEEAAWRLLYASKVKMTLMMVGYLKFTVEPQTLSDTAFAIDVGPRMFWLQAAGKPFPWFPNMSIPENSRHAKEVLAWAERQIRLEHRLIEAAHTLKTLVNKCNTVGQWKRCAPELLAFLPEKYQLHLRYYTKRSPLPDLGLDPENIKRLYTVLATAKFVDAPASQHVYVSGGKTRYQLNRLQWTEHFYNHAARKL